MHSKAVLCLAIFLILENFVMCRPSSSENQNPSVVCTLPEVRGHCRALLPRWRYDPTTGKCHEFKFGGCDGNGNNFMSQKACMSVCAGV